MPKIEINGHRLYYIERGKGPAILFIHPPVLTSLNFLYQLQGLSDVARTIAFDIRGHGRSEPSAEPITYPMIVEDIRQLMNQLNIEKALLCGYSTGGSIVLEFLINHPERSLGGIVIGGMSEVSDKKLRRRISIGRIFTKFGAIKTIAFSVALGQTFKLSLFRRLFSDAKQGNAKNAEQYYQYSLHYNCTEQLEQITQPVLLVYGEKDKSFHRYAALLQRRLPQSELYFVKKTSHQIPTKAADELNRLIKQFMERHRSVINEADKA